MKIILAVVFLFLSACDSGSSVCTATSCPNGFVCDGNSGECVDLCAEINCPLGATCDPATGQCEADLPQEEALCEDQLDNDGDGYTDCEDLDCQGTQACAEECDDGVDNDGDGAVDCFDSDCQGAESCHELCDDGLDNDGDGFVDCDDPDCVESCTEPLPNEGWIGGLCDDVSQCEYEGAFCLSGEPYGGLCSSSCELYCPDSELPNHSVTFCVEDRVNPGQGICVARCDYALYPESGCREGYLCQVAERFNQSATTQSVCLPPSENPQTCTESQVPQPNAGIVAPAGLGGCPEGMGPVGSSGVCMDRWEAHLVEVLGAGQTAPHSPYFNPGTKTVRAVSAPGAVPQGYITQVQAEAACLEAGKRLCSNSEWELACRTAAGNIYPYGNVRQEGWCNDARSPHPVVEYFGTSDSWIWSELDHPCINQLESSLDLTGANPDCVTTDQIFDLMGNLHEWTADPNGTFKGVLRGHGDQRGGVPLPDHSPQRVPLRLLHWFPLLLLSKPFYSHGKVFL